MSENVDIPEVLPVLPIRDLVVFPYMIVPLFVSRDLSRAAVDEALAKDRLLFLVAQKDSSDDDPRPSMLHEIGTVGMIMRMRKLNDGRLKVLVQGLVKGRVERILREKPCYSGRIAKLREPEAGGPHEGEGEGGVETEALVRSARENLEKLVSHGKQLSPDVVLVLQGIKHPGRLADLLASNLGLKVADAQSVLETMDPMKRLALVNEHMAREDQVLKMQEQIQSQARDEMSKAQREYFLREQLRQIRQELGETEDKEEEIDQLRGRIAKARLPAHADEEARRQLRRLEQMHGDSAEAGVIRTYVEWLADIPWSKSTEDALDLKKARKVLDDDHYDLEKVKERILEYLGVRKLKRDMRGPILCFSGPPGVGKTSLGRSIARALGRQFVRVSLGGVRDEAEIRGHRRTYVGAMPGRIIQGMKQAGSHNPVFMLDEVDKLGSDGRGDPSSALLEVLDPEQNHAFRDHYLNVDFDLSKVLWIATANLIDAMPPPLRDRMEIITLSGYTEEEKQHIARTHLVPKQLSENGLSSENLKLPDPTVLRLIREFTREAGLRGLERQIAAVARKIARRVAEGEARGAQTVRPRDLLRLLGPPLYLPEPEAESDEIGQATGLAWTAHGGEILRVEASAMRGKGGLILTGQLGEVMKESAQAALTCTRSRAEALGASPDFFQSHELHIHVPAGAIPKDGPSAGVTMACALVSLVTSRAVRRDVAMTGEITLRGHVLPVGGVKEKVLAAARAGMKAVVLPEANEKDLGEIPPSVRRKMRVVLARTLEDLLSVALVPEKQSRAQKAVASPVAGAS